MRTRATNAEAHPGKALETLRTRRPKEVIQKEKDEREAKKNAKEQKRLVDEERKEAGREYISQLEAEVTAKTTKDKFQYPRHKVRTNIGMWHPQTSY